MLTHTHTALKRLHYNSFLKIVLFLVLIFFSFLKSYSQKMSRNGYWTSPKDTIRVFLVFAEMLNDPKYSYVTHADWPESLLLL